MPQKLSKFADSFATGSSPAPLISSAAQCRWPQPSKHSGRATAAAGVIFPHEALHQSSRLRAPRRLSAFASWRGLVWPTGNLLRAWENAAGYQESADFGLSVVSDNKRYVNLKVRRSACEMDRTVNDLLDLTESRSFAPLRMTLPAVCQLQVASLQFGHQVIAGADAQRHDRQRGILARIGWKSGSVCDKQVWNVVRLLKLVQD